jgi:hypothetical protein
MRPVFAVLSLALCGFIGTAAAQAGASSPAGEPVVVFTEHPRLFLRAARLRLLQRERERASARWQQLDAYITGGAPLPESGFAHALYYQISGNASEGRRAIAWALGPAPRQDLRQLALVYDWCQKLLTEPERKELETRMAQGIASAARDTGVAAVRSRVLAAVALYDHVRETPNHELASVVHNWWEGTVAPALCAGRPAVHREDAYALWEILHAIRDNTNVDLREACPRFFKRFPLEHLMSHYPAAYPGEDNDFRITASRKTGEPDLQDATLSRAAELAMVAFDTNAEESQYLQGWLMHDQFSLRSPLGAPYEFLWANPYQPGLSYTLLPLVYHNEDSGTVFARSDWEESAVWFGYFDGVAQSFRDGRLQSLNPSAGPPIVIESAVIYFGASKFRVRLEEGQNAVVIVGLAPRRKYQVEIDDEEVAEEITDAGGVLVLDLLHGKEVGVRLREAPQ